MKYRIKEYECKIFGDWHTLFKVQSRSFLLWKDRKISGTFNDAWEELQLVKFTDSKDKIGPNKTIYHYF